MPDANDMDRLRDYARLGSEAAFAELVQRHINLVYSVAHRHVGIAAQAEEITQAVFIILARKGGKLSPDTILEGWLFETTRLTALSFLRGERRRQFREQEAYMQSTLNDADAGDATWNQLAPLLDEAMAALGKKDRDAVVLRFFKEKNVREVAMAMRASESAVQRRILRALDKLRRFFNKRGVSSTTAIIAGAISTNAVQAAPAALAKSITAVALTKGAATSVSTLTLAKGVLKIMAWTKAKTAIVAGAAVILVATSTTVIGIIVARARSAAAEPTTGLSPIAQTVTADIQPDGTILFQLTAEETNNTSLTISADNINDADGISQATDESGRPLRVTKRSHGGVFVMLNRGVPPGRTVSYTVEGKATGFMKANGAGVYELALPYGDIGNVTEAHLVQLWRLPAGATLLQKDGRMTVTTNEDGRIELGIDEMIPPNGKFPLDFRYRLATAK